MSEHRELSRFLSYVLRHKPESIGLELDENGWVSVSDLIEKANASGQEFTETLLHEIVANNDKQRFAFNEDATQIRANQGHSVAIELDYEALVPPAILYHGTVEKFMDSIKERGLRKGDRHHVHLSADKETAEQVGARRGKPVVLTIRAAAMYADGHLFYKSINGVWLTNYVPTGYLLQ